MILWTGDRSGRCLRQEVNGHTSCYVHEKAGQLSAARFERVAKLRFTTRKQIRALAPHAKKLRFSTLANLSEKNPWHMSPDFSDFY